MSVLKSEWAMERIEGKQWSRLGRVVSESRSRERSDLKGVMSVGTHGCVDSSRGGFVRVKTS